MADKHQEANKTKLVAEEQSVESRPTSLHDSRTSSPQPNCVQTDLATVPLVVPNPAKSQAIEATPIAVTPVQSGKRTGIFLRNWAGAILAVVTVNTYVLLFAQADKLIFTSGLSAWVLLLKFNFLALVGLFTSGPQRLLVSLNADPRQVFYIALVVYASLFLLYPLAIWCPAPGERICTSDRSTNRQKLVETVAVWIGLALFIPIPCGRIFRAVFWSRWKRWQSRRSPEAKISEGASIHPAVTFWQLFPESLATVCENFLVLPVLQCLMVNLLIRRPMNWSYDGESASIFGFFLILQLFCAVILTFRLKRLPTNEQLKYVTGAD